MIKLAKLIFAFYYIANVPLSFSKTSLNETIVSEYIKLQKEYSTQSCRPGTESAYLELDKQYHGDGNFIPVLLDEKIDLKTIKNLIPLMKEKSLWMQGQIDFLKKIEDTNALKANVDNLEEQVSSLIDAQKDFYLAKDKDKKEKIKEKAEVQFQLLLKEIEKLKNEIPFLLSFKFPVNHLSLRTEYEKYKLLKTKEARLRANSIYLFRKIVQDGSYDEDLSRNDSTIRSAFDTLYLALNKDAKRSFLTDNERVDLNYIFNNFNKLLSLKSEALIARFTEWKARNDRTLLFYQDLVSGAKIKISEESDIKDITALLEERAKALYTLKDFVLTREASSYVFWSAQSELMQSLFAIETILYSEVGRLDAPDALERRDVAQVVINRSENSFYNQLKTQDAISKYLPLTLKTTENKWLNVLFKEGEFSFTYFYIPGNFHIYCPDMSRIGQFLRRENVRIALELLNKPRKNFTALRYFSRTGMFGRIEMDSLWTDFRPLSEVPGKPVRNPTKILDYFKRDRYKFLYEFTNEELKKDFLVVEIMGKIYVVDAKNKKQIYYYRNPHQFKYFTLLK